MMLSNFRAGRNSAADVAARRFVLPYSAQCHQAEDSMSDHVYKSIELTGSSVSTVEDAVQNAIAKAAKTMRNMQWFQVMETRGHIADNKVEHWQVTLKIGFRLED
jgi:flavin-binding protein dodecin